MLFGLLFTAAAGGDALVLWRIRQEPAEAWVLDHPTQAGCMIVEPPDMQTKISSQEDKSNGIQI
jgi:hypothetical protein